MRSIDIGKSSITINVKQDNRRFAIDLFLREEDAQAALEDALRDEPNWAGTLSVEPTELNELDLSPN